LYRDRYTRAEHVSGGEFAQMKSLADLGMSEAEIRKYAMHGLAYIGL
jgi:hypothetical protein